MKKNNILTKIHAMKMRKETHVIIKNQCDLFPLHSIQTVFIEPNSKDYHRFTTPDKRDCIPSFIESEKICDGDIDSNFFTCKSCYNNFPNIPSCKLNNHGDCHRCESRKKDSNR